jgi:hypothetical protein
MSAALDRVLRWAVDPACREEIAGDLVELYARRRRRGGAAAARRNLWRDVASVCLRQSRLAAWARRRPIPAAAAALAAITLAALGLAPRAPAAPLHYTVNAADPAGVFTLEFEGTRIIGATMEGEPVELERLRQDALHLVIVGGDEGRDFEIAVKPEGGITWQPRSAPEHD